MGSFYTNIMLAGADVDSVAAWLQDAGRDAFVVAVGRTVVVYDAAGEAQDGSHIELARLLSAATGSRALAVLNHDSDMLVLDVFDTGVAVGELVTPPDLFDDDLDDIDDSGELHAAGGEPPTLDAAALANAFGGDTAVIAPILHDDYVFAEDRHVALVDALGLAVPPALVAVGFAYLERGEVPADGPPPRRIRP